MAGILASSSRPSSAAKAASPGQPLIAGDVVSPRAFAEVRRACMLEHCKWDPQSGDSSTLSPFPLFLPRARWAELSRLASCLAAEVSAAEAELSLRPELHPRLGLPAPLARALSSGPALAPPSMARTLRLDFHWTTEGWRVSEVNSDVPGGYAEAESFARLMRELHPGCDVPGEPGSRWAEAVARAVPAGARVALLSAPFHMEDHQVVAYLAQRLAALGLRPTLAAPWQIGWRDGAASLRGELGGLVRFFQAEWLALLPPSSGWRHLFAGGITPVTNAGSAALSESKRLPLVWGDLASRCPEFERLLPETRDPRRAAFVGDEGWVLKRAFSNTGEHVLSPRWSSRARWASAVAGALLSPSQWAAQRAFDAVALDTPEGPRFACVGVFTVDGECAGAYARLSRGPVVDSAALDAALLLRDGP